VVLEKNFTVGDVVCIGRGAVSLVGGSGPVLARGGTWDVQPVRLVVMTRRCMRRVVVDSDPSAARLAQHAVDWRWMSLTRSHVG